MQKDACSVAVVNLSSINDLNKRVNELEKTILRLEFRIADLEARPEIPTSTMVKVNFTTYTPIIDSNMYFIYRNKIPRLRRMVYFKRFVMMVIITLIF